MRTAAGRGRQADVVRDEWLRCHEHALYNGHKNAIGLARLLL